MKVKKLSILLVSTLFLLNGFFNEIFTDDNSCTNENYQAGKVIAAFFCDSIEIPDSLIIFFCRHVHMADENCGADFPGVYMNDPFTKNELFVSFDTLSANTFSSGNHPQMNELQKKYPFTFEKYHSNVLFFITFKEEVNIRGAIKTIARYQGVEACSPNSMFGDWGMMYPRKLENGYSYLIYRGYGDCFSGCIDKYYWYVEIIDGEINCSGKYHENYGRTPDWWFEAEKNIEYYRSGY